MVRGEGGADMKWLAIWGVVWFFSATLLLIVDNEIGFWACMIMVTQYNVSILVIQEIRGKYK